MKNRLAIIVLILICAGLSVVLILNQKKAAELQKSAAASIGQYSNQWVSTSADLDQQRRVSAKLEDNLQKQNEAIANLSNVYTRVSTDLEKTDAALKDTQKQVAQRDAKINELESQKQELDQKANDLSTAITNLTVQIDQTKQKLAASEGDKAFLEKELQRLMAEKAELERRFNDLAVLRTQVAKLKEELNISRRLRWIREGLFASSGQKGAALLMQPAETLPATEKRTNENYDLNVEVSADGSVRTIPPLTNSPAATNPPASQ